VKQEEKGVQVGMNGEKRDNVSRKDKFAWKLGKTMAPFTEGNFGWHH
jgi:hypothetical protein